MNKYMHNLFTPFPVAQSCILKLKTKLRTWIKANGIFFAENFMALPQLFLNVIMFSTLRFKSFIFRKFPCRLTRFNNSRIQSRTSRGKFPLVLFKYSSFSRRNLSCWSKRPANYTTLAKNLTTNRLIHKWSSVKEIIHDMQSNKFETKPEFWSEIKSG